MSKMKKYLLTGISYVLVAALAIGGTIAYLQDSDEDVNVMTLGNVQIEQIEQERDANGELVDFTQAKPAYPTVGSMNWTRDLVVNGAKCYMTNINNVVDKIVTVNNTGKTDAYVRTIVAIEAPEGDPNNLLMINWYDPAYDGAPVFKINTESFTEIDGVTYYIAEVVYNEALAAGAKSAPSLLQVYLTSAATNEDCAKFGDTWDVLVLSQAVQAAGFENAQTALDTAFGKVSEKAVEWFGGMEVPTVFSWKGVNYITEGDTATVNAAGGDTVIRGILSEGQTTASNVVIGEGITRLNNRALCKDENLKTVSLPSSLTYIDEGVFQQSGFVEIEIPENVTYIGKTAFGACPNLEKIVIKAKNVTFANYVGRDCKNLKEVYIYSDSVTFESGSMYFTNAQTGDASGITFYVSNQAVADALYNSSSATRSYGMLIKSIDGATTYYNTLK